MRRWVLRCSGHWHAGRRGPLPVASSATTTALLSSTYTAPALPQVDLSMEPHRREAMLGGSDGLTALPQLHVNGRYIGSSEDIQARGGRAAGGRQTFGRMARTAGLPAARRAEAR